MDCRGRVPDIDAKSYGNVASVKILARHAHKCKKKKYEEARKEECMRDFVPSVYSVDSMLCKEARTAELLRGGL